MRNQAAPFLVAVAVETGSRQARAQADHPTLMTKAEVEPFLAGGQVHRDCNGRLVMLSNHSAWQQSKLLPVYDNPESEQHTPMPLLAILDLVRHGVVVRVG